MELSASVREDSSRSREFLREKSEAWDRLVKSRSTSEGESQLQMRELGEKITRLSETVSKLSRELESAEDRCAKAEIRAAGAEGKLEVLENENKILQDQMMNKAEQSSDAVVQANKTIAELRAMLDGRQKDIAMLKERKK